MHRAAFATADEPPGVSVPAVARPRTDYRVELDGERCFVTDRDVPLELPRAWTPEHLVLAALVRCSLLAAEYHARRASIAFSGTGSALGAVNQRDDGLYGFVDIECNLEIELDPAPDDVGDLIRKAERGCFIGASLTAKPRYRWRVNGEPV